jgi:hypothetical protein
MTVEIREQIFNEDLAAQLLAEKADVAADRRPEIEQDRGLAAREARQEFPERLGRK